jgi:hypothetical protein
MPITALPPAPSRSDTPANFVSKADAFVAALPQFVTDANALETNVTTQATNAASSATAASGSATNAQTAANSAQTSANAAVAATGYAATSNTSLSIATGATALALNETGKAFQVNDRVTLMRKSAGATRMRGAVTAFTPGTGAMTVSIDQLVGSGGPFTDWMVVHSNFENLQAAAAADVRIGTDPVKAVTAQALAGSAAWQTLTDASTIAWDVTAGYDAKLTLTASGHTIGAPTGMFDGQTIVLNINPGAFTLAGWNAIFDWGANGVPTLTANAWSKVTAQYNSARGKLEASFWKGA